MNATTNCRKLPADMWERNEQINHATCSTFLEKRNSNDSNGKEQKNL